MLDILSAACSSDLSRSEFAYAVEHATRSSFTLRRYLICSVELQLSQVIINIV